MQESTPPKPLDPPLLKISKEDFDRGTERLMRELFGLIAYTHIAETHLAERDTSWL